MNVFYKQSNPKKNSFFFGQGVWGGCLVLRIQIYNKIFFFWWGGGGRRGECMCVFGGGVLGGWLE